MLSESKRRQSQHLEKEGTMTKRILPEDRKLEQMLDAKICSKCGQIKEFEDFHVRKASKDGRKPNCKSCVSKYMAEYTEKNKERIASFLLEYRKNNREKARAHAAVYNKKNAERLRKQNRAYARNNRDKINKRRKKYLRENPTAKLACAARTRMAMAITAKGFTKKEKTADYLGCDWETFKQHLESQFDDGMTLSNHGEWHIDHIVPLASAKTEKRLRELLHYTNTQPLWAKDNLTKGARMPEQLDGTSNTAR